MTNVEIVTGMPYSESEKDLGVPVLDSLVGASNRTKEQMAAAMAVYLSGCDQATILQAASNLDRLYTRSTNNGLGFGIEHVDVFARAAVFALEQLDEELGGNMSASLKHTRKIVGYQQGKGHLPPLNTQFVSALEVALVDVVD